MTTNAHLNYGQDQSMLTAEMLWLHAFKGSPAALSKCCPPGALVCCLQEDGSPDALIQSILGLALTILLLFLVVNILLKTALVAWTLVGAAVRYSAVAFLLIAVAAFLL